MNTEVKDIAFCFKDDEPTFVGRQKAVYVCLENVFQILFLEFFKLDRDYLSKQPTETAIFILAIFPGSDHRGLADKFIQFA